MNENEIASLVMDKAFYIGSLVPGFWKAFMKLFWTDS